LIKVHDTLAPTPVQATLAVITGQCSATLPAAPTANDNCDGSVITGAPDQTGPFGEGDYTITWSFTDSKGNQSSQTQQIKVHDTIAPTPVQATLAVITGQCSASLPAAPTATDNCDGSVITGVADQAGPFGEGDYTITWKFTDSKGNQSSQTQLIKVHDTI